MRLTEELLTPNDPKLKKWATTRQGRGGSSGASSARPVPVRRDIEPGDAGIWATCNKGKEAKCVGELKTLFDDYASRLYGHGAVGDEGGNDADDDVVDVEAEIAKELESLRKPSAAQQLFASVRLDTPCVAFFKVLPPIEPVSFVQAICKDAADSSGRKQCRSVQRLTPISLVGKATEKGLEEVAKEVLRPHFHEPGCAGKKFAIRPNLRNHSLLTRDGVIKQVATAVGPGHQVDLKNYDVLILVELYKNVCGMSVVGKEYDTLRKFNIAELYAPASRVTSEPGARADVKPKGGEAAEEQKEEA
ncbi:hypothetical protein EJ06DRAFT_45884 [Trichodelitschia bisporula]|uniref:THUMP domain-containing protein n=1 Tax=Trichodelitschia bisporula TaxID=703511 RepID=A0A6G1HW34_9PEZI|nr:hypothetical protein EJ06DRAFT_45884 [Trichodelitschia bisporula]